uniref:Uncharacterized protein n=1 Tax=Arundo donax TaxID=35708 RepID=A0A0A9AGQ5_ARUDO
MVVGIDHCTLYFDLYIGFILYTIF